MNQYILTLVLKPDLEEKERKALLDSVTKQMGKVEKEDLWGNRDLAFPINKQKKGFYAHFEFSSEPSVVPGMDKSLKLNEDILRFLLIRK